MEYSTAWRCSIASTDPTLGGSTLKHEGRRQTGRRSAHAGSRLKLIDASGRSRLTSQPSSRTGENSPYGMIGGIEETSASFEARSAPRSYPTGATFRARQLPHCEIFIRPKRWLPYTSHVRLKELWNIGAVTGLMLAADHLRHIDRGSNFKRRERHRLRSILKAILNFVHGLVGAGFRHFGCPYRPR